MVDRERFNAATFFVDRHVAEGRGARTAFRAAGGAVSYGQLAHGVDRFARTLAEHGVELENRVLFVLEDTPAFAVAFWATVKLGAVAVPVNTLLTAEEYRFLLDDSRAKVAVVDGAAADRIHAVRDRCPFLRAVIGAPSLLDGADSFPSSAELDHADTSKPVPTAATVREDIMYWGYTSGSTGEPKAAVHSHKDFVAAADMVGVGVFGLGADDVVFSASKMFFAFGLGNSLYFPARVGATAVLVRERIDAERAFDVITRERPTVFFTVPTLYARMLQVEDAEERFDLSSLRLCVSSGEALPPALFDAWHKRFGHELVDVMGSTEALHDFLANLPGSVRRGSAGRLVPGFEARLVDDAGAPVSDGTVGHLFIKGETTSPYYWNRLERTRATMHGPWLRTGDMLWRDADGYFYFAGRADDMLKVAGAWVSPAEIEGHLAEHPAVLEAAVAGVPDPDGLPRPHAFVVLRPSVPAQDALARELLAFLTPRLPAYKLPRQIRFVDELPKTATGKVQRVRLRAAE
jgi:benzoate-CoA ligase family protein